MKLNEEIKTQIKKNALDHIKRLKIGKRTNLHILDEVLPEGQVLKAAELSVQVERKTAFVFHDCAPNYNWAHPCEYQLYDAETGKLYKKVAAALPPTNIGFSLEATAFYSPVVFVDTKAIRASWTTVEAGKIGRLAAKKYAILFTGRAANRHTNDMEFLYRTLVDVYKFNPENIQVLNHDGTVNYFYDGSTVGSNLGNWPGDNTPYRMKVNGPGTRAGFQTALQYVAGKIKHNDLLFIHTSNHGGGPCDPGISDYCMFQYDPGANWVPYYQSDFIADLGVLPRFETLMVMMEQCRSGGFINPIINNSPANVTHVATAVNREDYSLGGWNFDPFAEDWIAAINGSYPDGTGLKQTVDTNKDGWISANEAFNYANAVHTYSGFIERYCLETIKLLKTRKIKTQKSGMHLPSAIAIKINVPLRDGDTPTLGESPTGCGDFIFL